MGSVPTAAESVASVSVSQLEKQIESFQSSEHASAPTAHQSSVTKQQGQVPEEQKLALPVGSGAPVYKPMTIGNALNDAATEAEGPSGTKRQILFIGSCDTSNDFKKGTKGIYVYELHSDGSLQLLSTADAFPSPNYLSYHPTHGVLYAVHMASEFDGERETGFVSAYLFDKERLELRLLNRQSACGLGPAHCSISNCGRHLLIATYMGGTCSVLPIEADGRLGPASDSKHHHIPGILEPKLVDRQECAHPHQIRQDPMGRVLVPDLGYDMVFSYQLTDGGGLVGAYNAACHYRAPRGSGPRHLDWTAKASDSAWDSKCVYVLLELSCEVAVLDFKTLKEVQRVSSLPEGVEGSRAHHRGNAHILVHPNGRWLYTTNRTKGACSITTFEIEAGSGKLKGIQHQSTLGDVPRNFCITADGKRLILGNQNDCKVVPFTVDQETGKLSVPSTTDIKGNLAATPRTTPGITVVPEPPAVLLSVEV